ncbi:hypothetical protein C8R43DRAFT_1107038 [Mycena crocata]|nr:hypothetical protein C8R43DRAFT_1107038 [Mycena crocata]
MQKSRGARSLIQGVCIRTGEEWKGPPDGHVSKQMDPRGAVTTSHSGICPLAGLTSFGSQACHAPELHWLHASEGGWYIGTRWLVEDDDSRIGSASLMANSRFFQSLLRASVRARTMKEGQGYLVPYLSIWLASFVDLAGFLRNFSWISDGRRPHVPLRAPASDGAKSTSNAGRFDAVAVNLCKYRVWIDYHEQPRPRMSRVSVSAVCARLPVEELLPQSLDLSGAGESRRGCPIEGRVVVCGPLCAGPKKTATLMVWSKGSVGKNDRDTSEAKNGGQ